MKELSDQEVLQAAIQKAIQNGWKPKERYGSFDFIHIKSLEYPQGNIIPESFGFELEDRFYEIGDYAEMLLFDHEFCEAIWPKEPFYHLVCGNKDCELTYNYWEEGEHGMNTLKFCNQCGGRLNKEIEHQTNTWPHHLKAMALSEDRIDYLRRHL